MNRLFQIALAMTLLSSTSLRAETRLSMPFETQQQSNWCWAAVSTIAINYMRTKNSVPGARASQCRIATHYNNVSSDYSYCCGNNGMRSDCNQPGSIHAPLTSHGWLNQQVDGQLTDANFDRLAREVEDYHRPVPAAIRWSGQKVGHAIIVYGLGFGGIAGGQAIYIYDPTTGRQVSMQDRNSLNGYGRAENGSWRAAYFLKDR